MSVRDGELGLKERITAFGNVDEGDGPEGVVKNEIGGIPGEGGWERKRKRGWGRFDGNLGGL